MSLVIEVTSPSPTTATSTTVDQEGAGFSSFTSPESPLTTASSVYNCTPAKSNDHLYLRFNYNPRSPAASAVSRSPTKRLSYGDKGGFQICGDSEGELTTPVKKAAKRLAELDPFTILDSNSRDSGFESEASRLSYSLSTTSVTSVNSNPGTPASSSSGSSVCLTNRSQDDPVLSSLDAQLQAEHTKPTGLCLWDDCSDPDLVLNEEKEGSLLSHILSCHVQPLELDREKQKEKDQVASFRCLWRGCKVYGKGSKLYSWLESHVVEKHAGPRPFACPLPGCLLRFGSKALAERHINSHFASDDQLSKGKQPANMTPSTCAKKPSPLASPRLDTSSSSVNKQQNAVNTRSSVKRRLVEERSQQSRSNEYDVTGRRSVGDPVPKRRRDIISSKQRTASKIVNGLKAIKACKLAGTQKNGIHTRQQSKGRRAADDFDPACGTNQRQIDEQKTKRRSEAGSAKNVLITTRYSAGSRQSSTVALVKKPTPGDTSEGASTTSTAAVPASATSTAGGGVSVIKRKSARVRGLPEDAFDAMYGRKMHVSAARYVLSAMKNPDGASNKRNSSSCQKCSGITFYPTNSSSTLFNGSRRKGATTRHCVCSDYITFHAEVLAKRTCISVKKEADDKSDPQQQYQLFCSWTPAGLLSPKWVDEASFKPTIRLSRSLFPSLLLREQAVRVDGHDADESLVGKRRHLL